MGELSDDAKYEMGLVVGKAILAMFRAMAALDGVTLQQAMDDWVSAYVAERIQGHDDPDR